MAYFDYVQPFGFSTGALAFSDWRRGLEICERMGTLAIELSALRYPELAPLILELGKLDLSRFQYVSLHLPSHFLPAEEREVQKAAALAVGFGLPVVLHPDAIYGFSGWEGLGPKLLIENMDKRKTTGRVAEELSEIYQKLPSAGFCFDFGHARQVDPTMSQAVRLLDQFGDRLQQIHFSDVDSTNHHRPLNQPAIAAFKAIRSPAIFRVPVILETTIPESMAEGQLEMARDFFGAVIQPVAEA